MGHQEAPQLQEGVWEGVPARPEGDVPLRPLSAADGAWSMDRPSSCVAASLPPFVFGRTTSGFERRSCVRFAAQRP